MKIILSQSLSGKAKSKDYIEAERYAKNIGGYIQEDTQKGISGWNIKHIYGRIRDDNPEIISLVGIGDTWDEALLNAKEFRRQANQLEIQKRLNQRVQKQQNRTN
jgi:hypothetical protein